jgi:hypothetical protein
MSARGKDMYGIADIRVGLRVRSVTWIRQRKRKRSTLYRIRAQEKRHLLTWLH